MMKQWLLKKFLHNFGIVTDEIHRSGQPGRIGLWLHWWLFPFRSVINLSWAPKTDEDDPYELKFCWRRGIQCWNFVWGAGGPKSYAETEAALEIMDFCKKPVWIHCEGGRDRTGGLIGIWMIRKGWPMESVFFDFERYKIPAWRWVLEIFREYGKRNLKGGKKKNETKKSDMES